MLQPAVPQEPEVLSVRTGPENYLELAAERVTLIDRVERELPDTIASPQEYKAVAALEAELGDVLGRHEPIYDAPVSYLYKLWQAACQFRKDNIDRLRELQKQCKRMRGDFERKEEEARRAEERRLAEEERRRAEAQRDQEAKLLEKQGQKEQAKALRQEPVIAPPITLERAVPRVTNVAPLRSNWTWCIAGCRTHADGGRKDKALRKQAAAIVTPPYRDLDDAALTATAKATKGTLKVPGIEFFEEKV